MLPAFSAFPAFSALTNIGHPLFPIVHHLAYVEGANLGRRSSVWQFASVIRGAQVGEDCSIGSCSIVDGARLGDRVRVGHGASIPPGVWIGDDVFIGPGVVVCNDPDPRVGSDFDLAELLAGKIVVRIEDGASIGAGSVILPGVAIGAGAMVAAGSVVTKDVPEGGLWLQKR